MEPNSQNCCCSSSSMESGKKRRLTADQVRLLERNFNAEKKLEHERKVEIAEEIGLRPRQVAVWFQNRRARSKTKKVENDFDFLNREFDKLKNEFDCLFKINQELKAEVNQLKEKLCDSEKKKKKSPLEAAVGVEAMDSSMVEKMYKVKMESLIRLEEVGSRSSSKSDAFYSEDQSPTREINQSHSHNFLQDHEQEEDDEELGGYLGKLQHELSADDDQFMDSFNIISTSPLQDQSLCFWSY